MTAPANFFYFTGTWLDSHERLQAVLIPAERAPTMLVHEMSQEEVRPFAGMKAVYWKDGEDAVE